MYVYLVAVGGEGRNPEDPPILDWERNQPRVRRYGGGGMLQNCHGTEVKDSKSITTYMIDLRTSSFGIERNSIMHTYCIVVTIFYICKAIMVK